MLFERYRTDSRYSQNGGGGSAAGRTFLHTRGLTARQQVGKRLGDWRGWRGGVEGITNHLSVNPHHVLEVGGGPSGIGQVSDSAEKC